MDYTPYARSHSLIYCTRMKWLLSIVAFALMAAPTAHAANPDLAISASSIRFSQETLIAGEEVRVYATVRNVGDTDMTGYVSFSVGGDNVGSSQLVTVVANGENEEVWIDFTVPSDPFNINAELKGIEPDDVNASNNSALTPLYTPLVDSDGDGVDDDEDNCPNDSNASQTDSDDDGIGNACDDDDDNDGVDDDVEEEIGTDPEDADTDDDGTTDALDEFPLDEELQSSEQLVSEEPDETPAEESSEEISSEDLEDVDELEGVEETTLIERSSGAVLHISPDASFVYVRHDWKTYEFEAVAPEGSYASLQWDFGDGASSSQRTIEHAFLKPGSYTVVLSVVDEEGEVAVDQQVIDISFFHLANPSIQIILGVLVVFFLLSVAMLMRTRTAEEEAAEKAAATPVKPAAKKKAAPRKTTRKKAPAKKSAAKKKTTTRKKKAAPKPSEDV